MTVVEITPDKTLMPKLWKTWYKLTEAIAELIDNSIDARYEDWEHKMEISIKINRDKISVADRWTWMDFDELKKAITLAKTQKKAWKLWHFWLWLKTSCLALWNKFKVRTSKIWVDKEYSVIFDVSERLKTEKREIDIQEAPASPDSHYTVVEITDLIIKALWTLPEKVEDEVQRRFSHFLDDIIIKVNDYEIEPKFPEITEWTKIIIDEIYWNWKHLTWRAGLMEKSSQKWEYWIHCYKYKRLIVPFNKIWFEPHATLWRIYWEINMDDVETTHDKKAFEVVSPEYREVSTILSKVLKPLTQQARIAKSKEKETDEVKRRTKEWWTNIAGAWTKIVKAINNSWWTVNLPTTDITNTGVKWISSAGTTPPTTNIETIINEQPKEWTKKFEINFAWQQLSFTHQFVNLGAEQSRKMWKYDSSNKVINVYSNSDFPVYFLCDDLPFLATIHIAEALSEFLLEWKENKNNLHDYMKIYISILRIAGEMKEEFKA